MNRHEKTGHFTLAHLLVTLGIVLLLVLALLPGLQSCLSERDRRRPRCMSNLKQIGLAMKQYALDNDETLLWGNADVEPKCRYLGMLYPHYVSVLEVFRCPNSRDRRMDPDAAQPAPGRPFTLETCKRGLSYAYGHNRGKPWTEAAQSTTRLAADKYANADYTDGDLPDRPNNHAGDGRNVVALDGSVRWDNKKGPLDADPEWDLRTGTHTGDADYEPDYESNPEHDQTGSDWWSDPPEK